MSLPRSTLRPSSLLLFCAIYGAVINILVAWACAQWGSHSPAQLIIPPCPASELPDRVDAYLNAVEFLLPHMGYRTEIETSSRASLGCIRTEITHWFDDPTTGNARTYATIQLGLPFPSMQYEELTMSHKSGGGTGPPMRASGARGGWVRPGPPPRTRAQQLFPNDHIYPLTPIPLGFAANSALYALLLFTFIIAPGKLRRRVRRRRGLCPHCAYPIGVSKICTECGANL